MDRIRIVTKDGVTQEIPLKGRAIIGRDEGCDITLDEGWISRRHAEIVPQGDQWVVRDLGSANGTVLNGQRVAAGTLKNGARIRIGEFTLLFISGRLPVQPGMMPGLPALGEDMNTIQAAVRAESQDAGRALGAWPDREKMIRAAEAIEKISRSIHGARNPDELFTAVTQAIMAQYPECDMCSVLLWDAAEQELHPRTTRTKGPPEADSPNLSRTAVNRALQEREAFLCVNAESDALFEAAQSIRQFGIVSFVCAPIIHASAAKGVLYLDSRRSESAFSEADLRTLSVIANEIALALQNMELLEHYVEKQKMEVALGVAQDIQGSVLPGEAPQVAGFDIAGRCVPCDETGGDYFDFIELPSGELGIAIGDVTGHGVGSALLMMSARSLLRASVGANDDMQQLLIKVNNLLTADVRDGMFMSLFYATLNPAASSLRYLSAGHDPGIMVRASSGEVELLPSRTCPMGIFEDFPMNEPEEFKMSSGDVLFLSTDGIPETEDANQELFGRERLEELIVQNVAKSPVEIIDAVLAESDQHRGDGEQTDDLTIVVIKAT